MVSVIHESLDLKNSLEESKEVTAWVADQLKGLKIPGNQRWKLATACQHLAIEHARAIIVLVDKKLYGSALALQRPLFETFTRGFWLGYRATDAELTAATKDNFPHFGKMINDSDLLILEYLKNNWWKYFCNYVHSGSRQILARISPSGLRSNYKPEEIIRALLWSKLTQLESGAQLAVAANNEPLANKFRERMPDAEVTTLLRSP